MAYGPNIVMSQVSASSPYTVSSTNEHPSYPAWKLCDGDDGSYWNSNGPCQAVVFTVDFGVGNAKKVRKYSVKFYSSASNSPSDWTFEGSNDNSNWTVLDTRTGQAANAGTTQEYEFANAVSYRYYRLNVTDGASPSDGMAFYTLGMFEALVIPTFAVYNSAYPTQDADHVKATTDGGAPSYDYGATFYPTDPLKKLTGSADDKVAWTCASPYTTNQRFHIDLGVAKVINRLYHEGTHHYGANTYNGPRHFTLWGSNDVNAFNELTYAIDTGWTQLNTDTAEFAQHVSSDIVDPHYILVACSVAYRYYAIKFEDNWGGPSMQLRRIVLQEGMDVSNYTANVVPAMTSDTTPSGVVTISSLQDGSLPGWEAFDHGLSTGSGENGWHAANAGYPAWITYQFPVARKIELYSFLSRTNLPSGDGDVWAPRDWTLQGSNNGTDWTVVDTRTGQQCGQSELRTYKVANPGLYTYYKVNVTMNVLQNPSYSFVYFQEIEYMERYHRLISPMITSFND